MLLELLGFRLPAFRVSVQLDFLVRRRAHQGKSTFAFHIVSSSVVFSTSLKTTLRRTFGRYFVFLIRGSTVGLFVGGPEPPVPALPGRFWGGPGSPQ